MTYRRRCAAGVVAGVVLLSAGMITAQIAVPNLTDLLKEPTEPAVTTISPLLLTQPALGLLEPLVVTDDELLTAGSSGTSIALSVGSPDFVVDDDLAECPEAMFTTPAGIQLAVTAAPPGSRIRVCPGTYTPVTIPIGKEFLTLEAPRQHGEATQCKAALPPDPTKDAIVDAQTTPAIGFHVQADGVTIYGFTVQNTRDNPGIFTSRLASGYRILFNVVQRNTFGLYLNSNGTLETLVSHNCFRLNNEPITGSARGNGIYSDQGLGNARVTENYFTGHISASMVFALNQQDLTIDHNDVVDDAGSIVLFVTQGAVVEYNHLVRPGGSGVFLGGSVSDALIRFNLIDDGDSTGINSNVAAPGLMPNMVRIEKNHVRGGGFDGIRLTDTDNSVVTGNKVERKGRDGIRLVASDGNTVENNLSRDNARDGMRVDAAGNSSNNTIERNKMLGNGEHDCHDDTAGVGTAATANFWINNIGKTENRPGLCKATP